MRLEIMATLDNLVRQANTLGAEIVWLPELHAKACWCPRTLEVYLNPNTSTEVLIWCLTRIVYECKNQVGGGTKDLPAEFG